MKREFFNLKKGAEFDFEMDSFDGVPVGVLAL
jgi:hypothetical protein